jgi:glycosyltransferase involved in cell wall biosynthesis
MHAQQAARAFHERGALAAFVTGIAFKHRNVARLGALFPNNLRDRITKELGRRTITEVPSNVIVSYPWLETLRTVLSRLATNPIYADMAWDLSSHRFDQHVAQRHLHGIQAVYAFEYTAKYTFEQAKRGGIATILAMPAIDSKEVDDIRLREEARFPELRVKHDRYFASRFATRYERRRAEIELADLVVANSEVTKQSHVRSGSDPAKIVVVPLAGPPGIEAIVKPSTDRRGPMSVVWAGTLSLRKGGHYFVDAWRKLRAGKSAFGLIYGAVGLPERILRPLPEGLEIMGSLPQHELFAAFEKADVLAFPTLADGFGIVITEAFSRGLPVITTDKAGGSALVEHGRNGLIIPAADSVALVEALRWCLDNRESLHQMRFHALETARRWQWLDYRRALVAKISEGLQDAGYATELRPELS